MHRSLFRPLALAALFTLTLLHAAETPAAAASNKTASPHKAKRVVILMIDGPRYTETWGEPTRQYIPRQNKELLPQGVLYTQFKNNGPTYTNAGHSAITTGFYQPINNSGKELPKNPSLFQMYLATGKPKTDAWIITSKDKLEILADTKNPDWSGKHLPSTDCGLSGNGSKYREDTVTWAQVEKLLPEHKPHLTLINFKEPDASGHAKSWENYLKGIRDTDEYAAQLWKLIQSIPEFKNQTALFITNDHGRHIDGRLDGFISHGDECSGCRHISLLAMGPDFKKGKELDTPAGQIDIAVTVAEILGLKIPNSPGRVLTELWEGK